MSPKELWIVSTKSTQLENCSIDTDGSEFYFAECILPASTEDEASAPIEHLLRDKGLELSELTNARMYNEADWADTMQFNSIKRTVQKVMDDDTARFAMFISSEAMDFEEDDDDGIDVTF